MPTATHRQSNSPRRRRLKQNRNPEAGMRNRQKGLFKKAHTWYRYYGGDVLIFIRRQDGRIAGYESRAGLLPEFGKISVPMHDIMGPDDFDTITERSTTPSTTTQTEKSLTRESSRSSTPVSLCSEDSSRSSLSSTLHLPNNSGPLPTQTMYSIASPSPLPSPSPSPAPSPSPSPSPSRKNPQNGFSSQTKPIPIGLRRAVLSFGI